MPTATTLIIRMPARHMATTVLIGLWVACSLAPVPGTTAGGMDIGVARDTGAAVGDVQDGAVRVGAMDAVAMNMVTPVALPVADSMAEVDFTVAAVFTEVVGSTAAGVAS